MSVIYRSPSKNINEFEVFLSNMEKLLSDINKRKPLLVGSSLHLNCHHHIVHSRFDLNIYYPPPYQRLMWDYKRQIQQGSEKLLIWLTGRGPLMKTILMQNSLH